MMSINHGRRLLIEGTHKTIIADSSPALKDTPQPANFYLQDEHVMKLDQLCYDLNSNQYTGVSCKHAKYLIKTYGENKFTRPGRNALSCFVRKFLLGKSNDEWSRKEWDKVFNSRIDEEYAVVRGNKKVLVRRRFIVRGDLIHLRQGQRVPADIRVVACDEHLSVDNRVITGNKLERKGCTPTSADLLMSQNMIFAGTLIIGGGCAGIVLATGDQTVFAALTQFATKVRYEYVIEPSPCGSSLSSLSSGGIRNGVR